MSTNLARVDCRICEGEVALDEIPRPITEVECGPRYLGMIVANAHCTVCNAKYLAWVSHDFPASDGSGRWTREPFEGGRPFVDLSFRTAFNDEPAPEDLPTPAMLAHIHFRDRWFEATQLRMDAVEMIEQAHKLEADALEGRSHWESYRDEPKR